MRDIAALSVTRLQAKLQRRSTIKAIAAFACAAATTPYLIAKESSKESALALLRDIPTQAASLAARGEPLLVLVSLPGCPHCERVRREELLPRQAAGFASFQLDMTSNARVVAGDGKPITHAELARRYNIKLAPTVLLLDKDGALLAEPLVGAMLRDFYGAYLDERLDAARKALLKR